MIFNIHENVWSNSVAAISAVWEKNTLFQFSISSAVFKDFHGIFEILKWIFVVF